MSPEKTETRQGAVIGGVADDRKQDRARPALAERPAFLLARLGRVAERRLNDQLAETGLKPSHAAILILLCDLGPLSQQDLGERLHVDPSNLVTFLNALEEDGLVVRRRDPADRRRHIVEVTEEGGARLPTCSAPVDAIEEELFTGLSAEDRDRLHRLLADVLATIRNLRPTTIGTSAEDRGSPR